MKLLITGKPGSGKSTLVAELVDRLKGKKKVGGMVTTELREGGGRIGFRIKDIAEGREGVLASVYLKSGPRLGKYVVNLEDLEGIGVAAVEEATESCDLVVIDEVGPMELKSARFRRAVEAAFESDKDVIATLHYGSRDRLVREFGLAGVEIVVVEWDNRDKLLNNLLSRF